MPWGSLFWPGLESAVILKKDLHRWKEASLMKTTMIYDHMVLTANLQILQNLLIPLLWEKTILPSAKQIYDWMRNLKWQNTESKARQYHSLFILQIWIISNWKKLQEKQDQQHAMEKPNAPKYWLREKNKKRNLLTPVLINESLLLPH